MLSKAKSAPDITNYLTSILCGSSAELGLKADDLYLARTAAAISLKNSLKANWEKISPEDKVFIKASVLASVGDAHTQIRNFAGNIIAEIVKQTGVMGWSEIYSELLTRARNDKGDVPAEVQVSAMSALIKICEDCKKSLDRLYYLGAQGHRPLDAIMPQLYQLTASQNVQVRAYSLECINIFIPQKPHVLMSSLEALMSRLFELAADSNDDVRRYVCRSFVQLIDVKPELILPHMEGLVSYMINQQRHTDDPSLALDAAEFWLSVGENKQLCQSLAPFLPQVIPVLLESMVYSEEDVLRLEGDREDADQEDRAEDIKPNFAKASKRVAVNGKHTTESGEMQPDHGADDDLSDGEIVDDDDVEEDPEDEWNLRKCSAAALDVLATMFHEPVFVISLPYLKENLSHKDWPNREAAVLAIGAVADGCIDSVSPHLPELIPYLLTLLQDPEPVVRKITCWALGRYTKWAMQEENRSKFFEPIMDGILKKMLDGNKSVQEGAASAFSNIEEIARFRLTPYCKPILEQFVKCYDIYKDRNMFILYDCVQTLAEHVGKNLANQELLDVLMPALTNRWEKVSDQSRELFPLLECLAYVATALDDAFAPYAQPIFNRCIKIVHQNLEQTYMAANNEQIDKPEKDFLITSLDLLSAIIGALPYGPSADLVANSQPKMFDLLRYCMEDANQDVRQSSYALLGDCASHVYPQLRPMVPELMPVLIKQIDIEHMDPEEADAAFAVINNACWSCGEIAREEKLGLAPYVERLYQRLHEIVTNPEIPQSVCENAAIALGRIGIWCNEQLAPYLKAFAEPFLTTVECVEDTDEKNQALLGFNRTVPRNPEALSDCLVEYLKAASFAAQSSYPDETLMMSFKEV